MVCVLRFVVWRLWFVVWRLAFGGVNLIDAERESETERFIEETQRVRGGKRCGTHVVVPAGTNSNAKRFRGGLVFKAHRLGTNSSEVVRFFLPGGRLGGMK